jgi:hypothetical protein
VLRERLKVQPVFQDLQELKVLKGRFKERPVRQVLLDYKVIQVIKERILWFKGLRGQQDLMDR